MRTVSFAPITLPEALVPAIVNSGKAALAAAAPWMNLRRERLDIAVLLAWREKQGETMPGLQHRARAKSSKSLSGTLCNALRSTNLAESLAGGILAARCLELAT